MSAEADAILEEAYRMFADGEVDWCQGGMGVIDGVRVGSSMVLDATAVCALGALERARRVLHLRHVPFLEAAQRVEGTNAVAPDLVIGTWNDDPHTTKEDVLLALKRARWDVP